MIVEISYTYKGAMISSKFDLRIDSHVSELSELKETIKYNPELFSDYEETVRYTR